MDSPYGDNMFDPEDCFDMDMENMHHVPVDLIIYLKNRTEPIFAQHVFFFEKENAVSNLESLMRFTSTWWSAVSEDKNIKFIHLSDSDYNKKIIAVDNVIAVSFITPEKPEWMQNGQDDSNSD